MANTNNGNDDPEVLIIDAWGADVGAFLTCLESSNFNARVSITVRTGSYDPQTQVFTPDITPYFDQILTNQSFSSNSAIPFNINVPETGGYLLQFEIEISDCSICCHGPDPNQCGSNVANNICQAGNPRIQVERIFTTDSRPQHDLNYDLPRSQFQQLSCVCGCDVDC